MNKLILCVILSLFTDIRVLAVQNTQECFNSLSLATTSQMRKIYEMSLKETVHTTAANDMFTCFLKASRYIDDEKSLNEKYFEIYKKCNELQKATPESLGKKQLNELIQLGLQQDLVGYLQDGIKSNNRAYIEESISYISDVMARYVEQSQEYKNYKKSILRKIEGETRPQPQQFPDHGETLLRVATFSKRSGQKSNVLETTMSTRARILSYIIILSFFF